MTGQSKAVRNVSFEDDSKVAEQDLLARIMCTQSHYFGL